MPKQLYDLDIYFGTDKITCWTWRNLSFEEAFSEYRRLRGLIEKGNFYFESRIQTGKNESEPRYLCGFNLVAVGFDKVGE